MKKLRLNLDTLAVESFTLAEETSETGTVRGHHATEGCTGGTYDDAVCGLTWRCSNVPGIC